MTFQKGSQNKLNSDLKIENIVLNNFKRITYTKLLIPFLLLIFICGFFIFYFNDTFINTYLASQKNIFLTLNENLSVYPNLAYNITYLGDALVLFSFVFIFLIIAPKLWEALVTASLLTLVSSAILKTIFGMPRPAAALDNETFIIIGRTLKGNTSLPSGHTMTAFMFITILLFAFMPKKTIYKILWITALILIGFTIGLSRVAVGAHYPLDVLIGCTLGYIMAVLGIIISLKLNFLQWMKNRKYYPIIMLILSFWAYLVILKLIKQNLPIFYISLLAIIVTFSIILIKYVKTAKA